MALENRVESLREYARLSRLRFDNGDASYLEVLYAENELFSADLSAVRVQAERYAELINVYKAFGGGWVELADPLASPTTKLSGPTAGHEAATTQGDAGPTSAP